MQITQTMTVKLCTFLSLDSYFRQSWKLQKDSDEKNGTTIAGLETVSHKSCLPTTEKKKLSILLSQDSTMDLISAKYSIK